MSHALLLLLLLPGCVGSFSFPGFRIVDDDDSADDDDSFDDDDSTDDDDATPVGGDLSCGPELASPGVATSAVTGRADWLFDFENSDLLYDVTWEGCEVEHFWDDAGDLLCAIAWRGVGQAYVAQLQSSALVVRFAVDYSLDESTCGGAEGDASDRSVWYRVTIPYGDGEITILTDSNPQAPVSQMTPWATVPHVGQGDHPSAIAIEYATDYGASP